MGCIASDEIVVTNHSSKELRVTIDEEVYIIPKLQHSGAVFYSDDLDVLIDGIAISNSDIHRCKMLADGRHIVWRRNNVVVLDR